MTSIRYCLPLFAAVLGTALAAPASPPASDVLRTEAERNGFKRTGSYDEVASLCRDFTKRYPDAVRCDSFGTTPEGRLLQVLVVSRSGTLNPAQARERGLPVVLIQGGIHAGEIDGKDAGFLALRELLDGKVAKRALEKQVVLFVPVFNVDGHERVGRWNRPNQRGPETMGWRTTAQNYNLNRDYVKADASEMQDMLALFESWDPLLVMDLHVTDGAQFEHDIAVMVEPVNSGDATLRTSGRALRDAVLGKLAKQGALPLPFYPSFVEYDNPASGFADGVAPPRFSSGYLPLRNRFGMLVETHSWKDYPTRVRLTRNTIVAAVEQVAQHGARWLQQAKEADLAAAQLGGTSVPLEYVASDKSRQIEFRGYAYTRTPSEISGALMTRYDESKPQLWKVPLRDEVLPKLETTAPRGGYLVPVAHAAWVGAKLATHGLQFLRLDRTLEQTEVEIFEAESAKFAPASFEGHQTLSVTGAWKRERRTVPAGALFVPIQQPRARLVMAMLEPQAPDSLLAWGGFNNHFEQKEYLEAYLAEAIARDMLAEDAALKAEFEQRLANDAAFAKDPAARLEFIHRRHEAWDERLNVYPVLRTDTVP